MKKLFVFLALLALTALAIVPAFAQDDQPSIPELLTEDADGRFTTLLAAVEAAGLVDALSGEGPLTLLAPTNDAITASLDYLGLTAEDLLADTDLLTSILTYHVIPEEYFFRELVGGPSLETLQGSPVQFNLEGGAFTVNGLALLDVDNVASNGVVHVLEDGVLLPPDFAATVGAGRSFYRVAHFSPDAGPVDVYVNGEITDLQAVEFGTVSDFIDVPAGDYEVAVVPAEGALEDAAIGPVTLTFGAGTYTTVAAIGSGSSGTLTAGVINETFGGLDDATARVTAFHGIEGAPSVNVTANGDEIISGLAFPGTAGGNDGVFILEVPAGTYDLAVVLDDGTSLLDAPATELVAGTNYLIAAIGTATEPQLSVTAVEEASVGVVPGANPAGAVDSMMTTDMLEATAEATMEAMDMTPEATMEGMMEVTPEATPGS